MADGKFHFAAKVDELQSGVKLVQIEDRMIAIFKIADRYHAIEDQCPHRGAPLSDGRVVENRVTCPWHNATFEIPTGKCLGGPSPRDLKTYPIRVSEGAIEIEV